MITDVKGHFLKDSLDRLDLLILKKLQPGWKFMQC